MRLREKPDIQVLFRGAEVKLNLERSGIEEIINFFGKLKPNVEYDFDAKERARRSVNANSYYWTLISKIAEMNGISKYEAHNHIMIDYGTDWIDADGERSYILMKDNDKYLRSETVHYRPTDQTEERNGVIYRWFILLLPSHLMNKSQMRVLIDGAVQEAQAVGINTRTPREITALINRIKE